MELKAALHGATAIFAITDFWSAIQTEQVACAVRDEGIDVAQIVVGFYNSNIVPGAYFGPEVNQTTKKAEFEGPVSVDSLIPFIDALVSTGPFVRELLAEPAEGISQDASQSQCRGSVEE
ncbi:NmrA-like family protein [Colletotrichum higginsianum IMI 349063]|uniref:NmrA-like family protein n=1 Tax=Colletotrichum higginsianum (strain IMI 349063) TaxID=759273 RepID=A0A1B7YBR2_COLHI|nr:NmrA-like family protein [Colletotrichum higginsianum IMI 349063]OBR09526.1 NmrA-like family protein [Colletotrichum higginsianum IMI 349063]